MKQPINSLLLFPFLALGIYLGSLSFFNVVPLALVFLGLLVLYLLLAYRGNEGQRWLFVAVLVTGTLLLGQITAIPHDSWVPAREGEFTGRIYAVRKLTYDTRTLVRLQPSKLKVAVHLPLDVDVEVGDELTFSGTVRQPTRAPNPGVFCYRSYLRGLGVFGVCYPDAFWLKPHKPSVLERVRNWLKKNILEQVRDPGLVLALVLGEREQLGSARQEIWRALGIAHLLAISGMHVGFVALGVSLLVRKLQLRPLVKLIVIQGALLAYIIVSGTGSSGWRALLVSCLGGYATFRGIRRDPLRLWATIGWLMLLAKPSLVFDLGFALSFVASGGILLWSPSVKLTCKNRLLSYAVNSLLISTIAQLSLAPLLLYHFGELPITGPVATLLFVPLVVALLVGGILIALGLGPLGFGSVVNVVMEVVASLERVLANFSWSWKLGQVTLWELLLWWCLFVYAGYRLRQPRLTKPKRTSAQLISLVVVALFISSLPPAVRRPLEVTALNVGQGDCFYIRTPSGVNVLIDGGGDTTYWQQLGRNVGKERVVPYLEHRQVDKLDYVILSHPHDDHLFGLLAVLEHFEVGMVIDSGHVHTTPTYGRYLELLEEKEIPYHLAQAGDQLQLGDGITLTVLYPSEVRPNLPSAYNNNSLLLRLQYGGVRMLFTGDLEAPVLYDLAHDHNLDLKAQWLKIPHHGSAGSLVAEFYTKVNPSWAVISVGPNRFGHPHQEVLELLESRKVKWRTTLEGPQTFHIWWGLLGRFIWKPS